MTLTIAIKSAEGMVLAAESRATVAMHRSPFGASQTGYYDHTHKLLSLHTPHTFAGILAHGVGTINGRTAYNYLPDFEAQLPPERLSTAELATRLSGYFHNLWSAEQTARPAEPDMGFIVAGYDADALYGRLYTFLIPSQPTPLEQLSRSDDFGMIHGGYGRIVDRLLQGYDATFLGALTDMGHLTPEVVANLPSVLEPYNDVDVPFEAMPLQACVDFALFLIRTTIDAQRFSVGLRNCGGPIEVATITRQAGLQHVQQLPV